MRRPIVSVLLLLFFSFAAHGQDRPKVEVFGGFSYATAKIGDGRINARGWHAMVAVNSRYDWIEFVADVSGHYGRHDGARTVTHVAMAGMRLTLQSGRAMGFVHSLYGISFGHPPLIPLEEFRAKQRVWFTYVPGGGGLDIVLNRRIALRVFQFDVIFHSLTPDYTQTYAPIDYSTIQPRLSCGIVLRFGKI